MVQSSYRLYFLYFLYLTSTLTSSLDENDDEAIKGRMFRLIVNEMHGEARRTTEMKITEFALGIIVNCELNIEECDTTNVSLKLPELQHVAIHHAFSCGPNFICRR